MLYTAKVEYGLRVALSLAKKGGARSVSLSVLAREEHLSKGFLEKIAASLKRAGIFTASKGVKGGYTLARSPHEITLADLMNAIDHHSTKPYRCPAVMSGVHCPREPVCAVKYIWGHIENTLTTSMKKITLADIMKSYDSLTT